MNIPDQLHLIDFRVTNADRFVPSPSRADLSPLFGLHNGQRRDGATGEREGFLDLAVAVLFGDWLRHAAELPRVRLGLTPVTTLMPIQSKPVLAVAERSRKGWLKSSPLQGRPAAGVSDDTWTPWPAQARTAGLNSFGARAAESGNAEAGALLRVLAPYEALDPWPGSRGSTGGAPNRQDERIRHAA